MDFLALANVLVWVLQRRTVGRVLFSNWRFPNCDPLYSSLQLDQRKPAHSNFAAYIHQCNPNILASIHTVPRPVDAVDPRIGFLDVAISREVLTSFRGGQIM